MLREQDDNCERTKFAARRVKTEIAGRIDWLRGGKEPVRRQRAISGTKRDFVAAIDRSAFAHPSGAKQYLALVFAD